MNTTKTTKFYYAVARGRSTGVFTTWAECKKHVDGFNGACYKKFPSYGDARAFVSGGGSLILGQLGITNVDPLQPIVDKTLNPHKPDDIVCFSDGSCLKNGKDGANAGYACVFPNHPKHTSNRKLETVHGYAVTNNRAEYMALIHALDICVAIDPSLTKPLYFYTDSQLLINTATKWIAAWKQKGWRKADGTAVLNIDLVEAIDVAMKTRKVVFQHVDAHTGNTDWFSVHNDQADKLAKIAAQMV